MWKQLPAGLFQWPLLKKPDVGLTAEIPPKLIKTSGLEKTKKKQKTVQ